MPVLADLFFGCRLFILGLLVDSWGRIAGFWGLTLEFAGFFEGSE
jgi:hypothetical protein